MQKVSKIRCTNFMIMTLTCVFLFSCANVLLNPGKGDKDNDDQNKESMVRLEFDSLKKLASLGLTRTSSSDRYFVKIHILPDSISKQSDVEKLKPLTLKSSDSKSKGIELTFSGTDITKKYEIDFRAVYPRKKKTNIARIDLLREANGIKSPLFSTLIPVNKLETIKMGTASTYSIKLVELDEVPLVDKDNFKQFSDLVNMLRKTENEIAKNVNPEESKNLQSAASQLYLKLDQTIQRDEKLLDKVVGAAHQISGLGKDSIENKILDGIYDDILSDRTDLDPNIIISPETKSVSVGSTLKVLVTGGVAPYKFAIVSGVASISPTSGKMLAGWSIGGVTISATDSTGSKNEKTFQVTAAKLDSQFIANGHLSWATEHQVMVSNLYGVFIADINGTNTFDLYSIELNGNKLVKLNDELPPGGKVLKVKFNHDYTKVIYLVTSNSNLSDHRLYAVNLDGSERTMIHEAMASNRTILDYIVSPKENKIIYLSDQILDEVFELYMVNLGSARSSKIIAMPAYGDVRSGDGFSFTPDGENVVFIADRNIDKLDEIYSVSKNGGPVFKLNKSVAGGVDKFKIAPDSKSIVYLARQNFATVREAYSATINVTASSIKLNETLVAGGNCLGKVFEISPDSSKALVGCNFVNGSKREIGLFNIGATGQLLVTIPSGDGLWVNAKFSSDSQHVIFTSDKGSLNNYSAYSVSANSLPGSEVTLTSEGTNSDILTIPLSKKLLITKPDQGLYTVQPGVAGETKITPALTPGGKIYSVWTTPDGSRVIYVADQDRKGVLELYSVKVNGSNAKKLNLPISEGGSVKATDSVFISPDSKKIVYISDDNGDLKLRPRATAP